MRKKIEYALMLLIIAGVTYWILSGITLKTDVKENVSVQIYEKDKYAKDSTIYIDGIVHKYLFSKEQYFTGKFNLENFDKQTSNVWIQWSKDKDIKMQTISSPTSSNLRIGYWMLIDKDMRSFAFTYDDGKIAATSQELMESYKDISRNYN